MVVSIKPYTTLQTQLELLRSRGMEAEEVFTKRWLTRVSYYRLSAYWYPYRDLGNTSEEPRSDQFLAGTSFSDVADLYEFDRKLRTLLHDGIERVEVALRAELVEILGINDPLGYKDPLNFRPTFDHSFWMETVQKRVDRARRHNEAIKHYDRKYSGELPIWVLTEVLDFSDLSKLYDALPAKKQWEIAHSLGINIDLEKLTLSQQAKVLKNHPLARWFEQLSIVRNTCAHHGRVWNRSFVPASTTGLRTLQEFQTLPLGQSGRIFGALVVMGALLNNVSPGSTWPLKIKKLVNGSFVSLRGREISEMGYPNNFLL